MTDASEEKKAKTKLTEALLEANTTGPTPMKSKGRAKDDADITIDVMEPRSESGRYWKEQYVSYSRNSEQETKKLIAKQKLARDYARKRDEEATDLRRQFESAKKRHHTREKELDKQVKDLREKLRLQLAENAQSSVEIAMLRKQLEISHTSTSDVVQAVKTPELADTLWADAGVFEDEKDRDPTRAYLQASVFQARGEQARANRNQRERRLARKTASVSRQDFVSTPERIATGEESLPLRTATPRPTRERLSSGRRVLADKSPNIASSPPPPTLLSITEFEKAASIVEQYRISSPTHRERMAAAAAALSANEDIFDDLAPTATPGTQAEQPATSNTSSQTGRSTARTTPTGPNRRHKRSEAKTGLAEDRERRAKERLAARRQMKANFRPR